MDGVKVEIPGVDVQGTLKPGNLFETLAAMLSIKFDKRFPLIDWGMSEADCLAYCYERGHEWREHGAATPDGTIRLYDILDRVSCWCCTNKNLDELRNVYHLLPEYWERLKDLQRRTCRPMKGEGKSVFDLETRFKLEDKRAAAGLSIRSREFFRELAGKLEAGGGNDGA